MWVVIVVSLLNKAYDDGRLEAMRKVLEEVPADLEEVFNKLLSKDHPNKGRDDTHAPITGHTIQRRITASSKGLNKALIGDSASVQFIHLSVNDFLFRNQRLPRLDQTLQPDPISASHGQLWDRFWSDIKRVGIASTSEQHMRRLGDNYPFLLYAASYVFDHAEKALSGGAMRDGIVRWLQTRDVCHQKLVTIILAEGGADVNAQAGKYGNALHAASYRGLAEIVRQLLEHGAQQRADVHGPDKRKEIVTDTVFEDRAKWLVGSSYSCSEADTWLFRHCVRLALRH
ncbi:hypothetical protein N658DRAFT_482468 [Parathielavia hyrcaniae]|uniref:Ankyrin repeat protein n=1 Tax=Parathielavia hyrcaniae TaxID=113614 RepID=A0AAN6QAK5_9PEZI|nr:hypothetical protein N658DRAFT_482468 [Parathielavia hyrcaniae]